MAPTTATVMPIIHRTPQNLTHNTPQKVAAVQTIIGEGMAPQQSRCTYILLHRVRVVVYIVAGNDNVRMLEYSW